MTVTIDIINYKSLNLLKEMENLGLIQMRFSSLQNDAETVKENTLPYNWLRGCCKNLPGGSVENFLSNSREEKERELVIDKCREKERTNRANTKFPS